MSDTLKLGKLITDEQERDAVHIAVVPVEAGCELKPGYHVGIDATGKAYYGITTQSGNIGIVDPFLKGIVPAGKVFWLFLYPGSITSLRHDWTHPAFKESRQKSESLKSRLWIKHWASQNDINYDDLMRHAGYYVDDQDSYWSDGGRFEGMRLPDGFWKHYEAVTGLALPEGRYENFFSCSC